MIATLETKIPSSEKKNRPRVSLKAGREGSLFERMVAFRELVAPRVDPTTTALFFLLNSYTFGKKEKWDEEERKFVKTEEDKDEAFPSRETLSRFLGVSVATVKRRLHLLEEEGVLLSFRRHTGKTWIRQLRVAPGYDKHLKEKAVTGQPGDPCGNGRRVRAVTRQESLTGQPGDPTLKDKVRRGIKKRQEKTEVTADTGDRLRSLKTRTEKKKLARKKRSAYQEQEETSAPNAPECDTDTQSEKESIVDFMKEDLGASARSNGWKKLMKEFSVEDLNEVSSLMMEKEAKKRSSFIRWVIADPLANLEQARREREGKDRDEQQGERREKRSRRNGGTSSTEDLFGKITNPDGSLNKDKYFKWVEAEAVA